MTTPRIAIFMQDQAGGGAERSMVNVMQGMVTQGVAVDLVTVRLKGPYVTDIPPQVRIIDLGCKRVSRSLMPLAGYLRKEKPDAMLSALTHVNVAAVLARILSRTSVRLVVSERSVPSLWYSHGKHNLLVRCSHHLRPWAYRKADGIITISAGVTEDLSQLTGIDRNRMTTIYNPVVTPQLIPRSMERVDHSWFIPGQPPVILGVGRMEKVKNFPMLIQAFARVRKIRPAKLVILGQGQVRPELEALVRQLGLVDDVLMPGFVSNPYAWMRQSALFVLSSDYEGLGNVLIEAMACGTPVIATRCPGGPPEILNHGQYGPLVPPGDAQALAHAMNAMLDHPTDARTLVQRANDFAVEPIARQYLQALLPGVALS